MKTINYRLSERDVENIDALAFAIAGSPTDSVHQSLKLARKALQESGDGNYIACTYIDDGMMKMSANISTARALYQVNDRKDFYRSLDVAIDCGLGMAEDLGYIKGRINTDSDEMALAFALQFARNCNDQLQSHEGIARLCLHNGNMKTARSLPCVFNRTFTETFNRACRKIRRKVGRAAQPKKPSF